MAEETTIGDTAPGGESDHTPTIAQSIRGYLIGLVLAVLLTSASFGLVGSKFVYGPAIPIALLVLAIAQMGVHLVFFLHISTGPDNTNNVLALAFGVLIVGLIGVGTLWIMSNLNHNMMPMDKVTPHMHRQS